jgi:hypothetical protein
MVIIFTNIFYFKVLKNIPKLGFFVYKYVYHLATLVYTVEFEKHLAETCLPTSGSTARVIDVLKLTYSPLTAITDNWQLNNDD